MNTSEGADPARKRTKLSISLNDVVQALVMADKKKSMLWILNEFPWLKEASVDRELTKRLNEAWPADEQRTCQLLACRTFLARYRAVGAQKALDGTPGLPLAKTHPMVRLLALSNRLSDLQERAERAEQTLTEVRRESDLSLWATLQHMRAFCLARSVSATRADDIEQALTAFSLAEAALQEEVGFKTTMYWASLRHDHAETYVQRVRGEREKNLSKAIELFEEALAIRERASDRRQWAESQHGLGLAWLAISAGNRVSSINHAIAHMELALTVFTRRTDRKRWGAVTLDLAAAYNRHPGPNRSESLERSIALSTDVAAASTEDDSPRHWGRGQVIMANAYTLRLAGNRMENLDIAIRAYEDALDCFDKRIHPRDWARTHYNLAMALWHVPHRREQNRQSVLSHCSEALATVTLETYPIEWALFLTGMGNVFGQPAGSKPAQLYEAIVCYRNALTIRTAELDPDGWATIQNNLGNAYAELAMTGGRVPPPDQVASRADLPPGLSLSIGFFASKPADLQREAIRSYQAALTNRDPKHTPAAWAETQNNLGAIYSELRFGARTRNWRTATEHLENALNVYTPQTFPHDARRAARNAAHIFFSEGKWPEAAHYYGLSIEASDNLYWAGVLEAARQAELGEIRGIPARHAYALARADDKDPTRLAESVLTVERNRARWLSEALKIQVARPERVPDKLWNEFLMQCQSVQHLQARELLPMDLAPDRDVVELSNRLSAELQYLETIVSCIRRIAPDFLPEPSFDDIMAQAEEEPTIYIMATDAGGLALAVYAATVTPIWLDNLNDKELATQLHSWMAAQDAGNGEWLRELDRCTEWLRDTVTRSIVEYLVAAGLRCEETGIRTTVTLIPTGLLALMPLHVNLVDGWDIRYAPSTTALAHCKSRVFAAPAQGQLLAVHSADSGDLLGAEYEVAAIKSLFPNHVTLDDTTATHAIVYKKLYNANVAHFACHGINDWDSPLDTVLILARREQFAVYDFMDMRLADTRLAVLSACETGLVGTDLPDEAVMLPNALIQAGYAAVVASLWRVDDRSTAMLMVRFYHYWLCYGLPLAAALCAAQRWLRDTSNRTKAAYFKNCINDPRCPIVEETARQLSKSADNAKGGPEGNGFAHPMYWAGFYLTGA